MHAPRARFAAFAIALVGVLVAAAAGVTPTGCAGQPACERNSDCINAYCADGECLQDCVDAALDCPKGYVCNAIAQCEYGGGTGPGGAGSGGGATSTGDTTTTGTETTSGSTGTTTTSSSTTSSSTGGGALQELDLCGNDGDCGAPLVCRTMVPGGAKRCTRSCSSDAQCMAGTRCIDPGGGAVCLGNDVGRTCNAASACNFGCLTGPKYCTASCASGSDCPNGYGCMDVGSPAVKVCVRAEAYCDQGDTSACIAPAACDLSPNMILGGCTLACSSAADCPRRAAGLAPWSCDGLCRRPADVYGPLEGGYTPAQYYCDAQLNVVNLCNDAQHINFAQFSIPAPPPVDCASGVTTDGSPGDACLDSCRYQGGCAFGFACSAVGQVNGQRIGLCLPAGGGEVGANCNVDGQCAFGYCNNGKCSRDCTHDGVCPTGSTCIAAGGPAVEGAPFKRCE